MRKLTRYTAVLIVTVTGLLSPQLVTTADALSMPATTVYFNNPLVGVPAPGAPSTLTAAIVALLDRTYGDSTVNIAMYQWNNLPPVPDAATSAWPTDAAHCNPDGTSCQPEGTDVWLIAQAIQNAANAGARINIVMDSGDFNSGILRNWVKNIGRVNVVECVGSCYHGGSHIQHNKFVIVDKAMSLPRSIGHQAPLVGEPVDQYLVLQMTSNWTNAQLDGHHFNSAVEFAGDQNLYDGFHTYWTGLNNCATQPAHTCGSGAPAQTFSGSNSQSVVTFPRSSQTSDPVKSELDRIDCSATTPSLIDIVVNQWDNDGRGGTDANGIEGKLLAAQRNGCEVRIVIPYDPTNVTILSALKTDFPETAHCSDDGNADLTAALHTAIPAVHSKYLLVAGSMDATPGTRMVFTGSETFKEEARADNDNVWMSVAAPPGNPAIYAQYEANFEDIWNSTPLCAAAGI